MQNVQIENVFKIEKVENLSEIEEILADFNRIVYQK